MDACLALAAKEVSKQHSLRSLSMVKHWRVQKLLLVAQLQRELGKKMLSKLAVFCLIIVGRKKWKKNTHQDQFHINKLSSNILHVKSCRIIPGIFDVCSLWTSSI